MPAAAKFLLPSIIGVLLFLVPFEVAGSKMRDGLAEKKVRTPAREAQPFYRAGAVVALALLVVAGLLIVGYV